MSDQVGNQNVGFLMMRLSYEYSLEVPGLEVSDECPQMSFVMGKAGCFFAYAKTKVQISCAVTP